MKSLLASFLAGALLLTAGCNQCDDVEPIVNSLGFILVSPTGQNLIGPAATQYQPTSLSVTFQGQPFDFIVGESLFGREPVGVLQTHCCLTGKGQARFLLRLTSTDTDTIDVSYRTEQGKCGKIIEYTNVTYNLRPAALDDNDYYRFLKR